MGFLYPELGFASADAMVEHMTGSLAGQVDCMLREVQNKHLVDPLNRGDYAKVARIYNGPGYAQNHYDTRLADADKRWQRKLAAINDPAVLTASPGSEMSIAEIKQLQNRCAIAVMPRSACLMANSAPRRSARWRAFRRMRACRSRANDDPATAEALRQARPIEASPERKRATCR
jgi:hypothetical protein